MNITLPNGYTIKDIPEGTSKEAVMQKAIAAGYATADDFPESPGTQEQEDQGFLGNVVDAFVERGEQFGKNMFNVKKGIEDAGINPIDAYQAISRGNRRIAGAIAGGAGDIVGEGVASALRTVADYTPGVIKDPIKDIAGDIAGSSVGESIGSAAKSVAEIYAGFRKRNPELAQDVDDVANIGAAVLPIKGLSKVGDASGYIATKVSAASKYPLALIPQSKTKQKIAKLIEEKSTDEATAPYQLKKRPKLLEYMKIGSQKIESDSLAQGAIKQGFDKSVIAAVKGASPEDKKKMIKMVSVMEKARSNARYGMTNRPGDVAGKSLMDRFNVIRKKNTEAGRALDGVAKSLKGSEVDVSSSVNSFLANLDDMGIKLKNDFTLDFYESDIEGLPEVEKILTNITKRMSPSRVPDAYDVHRLKKFIDEQVTYGKPIEGLKGKTLGILKKLRSNIDRNLDSMFPEYNEINTIYSDTVKTLNNFKDIAGKKMDLSGDSANSAVGTLLRRVMSNQQSRVRLLDSLDNIESTAKKYGGNFNDDIMTQILFIDELDKVFKPIARTSFQGQIGQALDRASSTVISPVAGAVSMAGKAADNIRGINEKAAFKSIKELLKGIR